MTDARPPLSDDDLQALLGRALQDLDLTSDVEAVPARVTEGSLWVHDFVTADSELAAIVADSDTAAPVGVRGAASVRSIGFATESREIDVEIAPGGDGRRRLSGLVVPGEAGTARLVVAGQRLEAPIDDRGQFVFADVPAGTVLLTLELGSATIRLDAFLL